MNSFCFFFYFLYLKIAALLTIPFDVVKTHRQIEMGEKEIYSGKYCVLKKER